MTTFDSQKGFDGLTAEDVREELPAMLEREARIEAEGCPAVSELYPSLRLPTHELQLGLGNFLAGHDRGRTVVLFHIRAGDEPPLLEVGRHRRSRIRGWMLDVRPVEPSQRKRQVGSDLRTCIGRVADNQPADDIHSVVTDVFDSLDGGTVGAPSVHTALVLDAGFQENELLLDHVLDAEEYVTEAGLTHQRSEGFTMIGDRRGRRLDRVIDRVQLRRDDGPADSFRIARC